MPYYKTEIEAGKTIEVIKSHTRSLNDHRPREKDKQDKYRGKVGKTNKC